MEDTQQAWLRPPQAVVPVLLQVPPATVVKSHTGPVVLETRVSQAAPAAMHKAAPA